MGRSGVGAGALALAAVAALGAPRAAAGQGTRHLWVLRPPDALVEYDVATFTPRRTLSVPRFLAGAPEYVDMNAAGQVLFRPPKDLTWAAPEMAPASGRMWLWDGSRGRARAATTTMEIPGRAGRTRLEVATAWWLATGGDALFTFESRFQTTLNDRGNEQATRNAATVGRAALDAAAAGRVDTLARAPDLPACHCDTGACPETCPEWSFWAPDGGVGDFFLLTRWIPGQLGSTYEQSLVYRRAGGRWTPRTLPQATESPLDASATGDLILAAELDAACCGWVNDSSDRLLLFRANAAPMVLYDELARFANADYDVSIAPRNARLAPGGRDVAYTLAADVGGDSGEVRLSSSGQANAAELARVKQALAQLPRVEVVDVSGGGPRRLAGIPRAALVGWLNEHELLLAQGGRLVVYDLRGGAIRSTGIPVRSERDAFLR